uniref:CTLH domain-containing protein n=1 Tax=Spongospora subterranea TaxID=70186 RepID=A0A0H5R536_9EUKA|eukprot:CRZ03239.1 hypothetical protein [Spongospora subterranea]
MTRAWTGSKRQKMSETNDRITTPAGYFVRRDELCRLIGQSLKTVGMDRSVQCFEKESNTRLSGERSSFLSEHVVNRNWEHLLVSFFLDSTAISSAEQEAREIIYRIQAFDLCSKRRHNEALECIRRSPQSLHGPLSQLLLFVDYDELKHYFESVFGEDSTSLASINHRLQKLLNFDDFIPENRLLFLIDLAYRNSMELPSRDGCDPLWANDSGHVENDRELENRVSISTPSGLNISFPEWMRILLQALIDLDLPETAAVLSSESKIMLDTSSLAAFRRVVLEGNWDEVYNFLPTELWQGTSKLFDARVSILKQEFFELCQANEFVEAIKLLVERDCPASLHGLAKYIIYTDSAQLLSAADFDGDSGTSRPQLLTFLEKLLVPDNFMPPSRLLILIDAAMDFQFRTCLYHNVPTDRNILLLKDHVCSDDSIPTILAQSVNGHTDEIWYVCFSHDGRRLASASKDSTVRVWIVNDSPPYLKHSNYLACEAKHVSFLCWAPDDSVLVVCSSKKKVSVWDPVTGSRFRLKGHLDQVLACAWTSRPSSAIFTGSIDQQIIMWSEIGEQLYSWRTNSAIHDLCVSSDGNFMYASASQSSVQIIDLTSKQIVGCIREPTQQITSCVLSADSQRLLITVVKPAEVHLWSVSDVNNPRLLERFVGSVQDKFIVRCTFGGVDSVFVASGSEDHRSLIWNRHTGQHIATLNGHSASVNSVSWNPVNPYMMVSASDDHSMLVWIARRFMDAKNTMEL